MYSLLMSDLCFLSFQIDDMYMCTSKQNQDITLNVWLRMESVLFLERDISQDFKFCCAIPCYYDAFGVAAESQDVTFFKAWDFVYVPPHRVEGVAKAVIVVLGRKSVDLVRYDAGVFVKVLHLQTFHLSTIYVHFRLVLGQ